jgi:hypothetical protein
MRSRIALVVAFFIPTLVAAQTADEKKATIKFLQGLQNSDGGFLPAPQDPKLDQAPRSSLRATSAAIRALNYFGGDIPDKEKAAKFVASCFDEKAGGFADLPQGKVDVISTSVGLMAAKELKMPKEPYTSKCAKFLVANAKTFEDIRIAAAGFEAIGQKPPGEVKWDWMDVVRKLRNDDYTTGKGDGLSRDTGSSIALQLRLGFGVDFTKELEAALMGGQREDGAYGKAGVKGSDLETTYRVMRAIHMLEEKPKDVEKLKAFIAKCRNADGGYGVEPGKPSSVGGAYYAATILNWLK